MGKTQRRVKKRRGGAELAAVQQPVTQQTDEQNIPPLVNRIKDSVKNYRNSKDEENKSTLLIEIEGLLNTALVNRMTEEDIIPLLENDEELISALKRKIMELQKSKSSSNQPNPPPNTQSSDLDNLNLDDLNEKLKASRDELAQLLNNPSDATSTQRVNELNKIIGEIENKINNFKQQTEGATADTETTMGGGERWGWPIAGDLAVEPAYKGGYHHGKRHNGHKSKKGKRGGGLSYSLLGGRRRKTGHKTGHKTGRKTGRKSVRKH